MDFIPTTPQEVENLGWNNLEIILISGDTYVDTYYNGVALIARVLLDKGYRVGIIAQPDITTPKDITRLGEPTLFWGVSSGLVDSMVANYTATKKFRKSDDFTPGGVNNRRPDRAVIKYSNLIRQYYKNTSPIVLGGIEASLRRVVHYDYWSNKIRKSILFDAKADILMYGMADSSILELASALKNSEDYHDIRGISYIAKEPKDEYITIESFDECKNDKIKFIKMFHKFYLNNDPITAKGLNQLHDNRYLIQNPPPLSQTQQQLDHIYSLPFTRKTHPYYAKDGKVKGLETIKYSITTHQGCYGECNFCAISVHQGTTIRSRSHKSIIEEAKDFTKDRDFKGIISDVGGATANMYGFECDKKQKLGDCDDKACAGTTMCKALKPTHKPQINLLQDIRNIGGIKKVFVNSGIRYDLINEDKQYGDAYIQEIVNHHVSGQLKIAPEHSETNILKMMGKPDKESLLQFKKKFEQMSKNSGKKQFLTYYMIAAHPASTDEDMKKLKQFTSSTLHLNPEQVQVFTPTPSTYSTLMYYTELDPWSLEKIFVEKDPIKKQRQKDIVTKK
jgi:uncharacterized radical SAM protein YgiQ